MDVLQNSLMVDIYVHKFMLPDVFCGQWYEFEVQPGIDFGSAVFPVSIYTSLPDITLQIQAGDNVLALFGETYYHAVVHSLNDCRVTVHWTDELTKSIVHIADVKRA